MSGLKSGGVIHHHFWPIFEDEKIYHKCGIWPESRHCCMSPSPTTRNTLKNWNTLKWPPNESWESFSTEYPHVQSLKYHGFLKSGIPSLWTRKTLVWWEPSVPSSSEQTLASCSTCKCSKCEVRTVETVPVLDCVVTLEGQITGKFAQTGRGVDQLTATVHSPSTVP